MYEQITSAQDNGNHFKQTIDLCYEEEDVDKDHWDGTLTEDEEKYRKTREDGENYEREGLTMAKEGEKCDEVNELEKNDENKANENYKKRKIEEKLYRSLNENHISLKDDENSYPAIICKTETANVHSYHDSDSDLIGYDYDDGRSIPGLDSNNSDIDSWNWTFPNESISDLDIKPILVTTRPKTNESSRTQGQTLGLEIESVNTGDSPNKNLFGQDKEHANDARNEKRNTTSDFSELRTTSVFERQKKPHESSNKQNQPVSMKDLSSKNDIVYFEDSSTSQVLKARLRYLYANSHVSTKTSRAPQSIKQVKSYEKRSGDEIRPVKTSKLLGRKSLNVTNSKFNFIEAKFMGYGPASCAKHQVLSSWQPSLKLPQANPCKMSSVSSMHGSKTLKTEWLLIPNTTIGQERNLGSRKRHSLNDIMSERLVWWRNRLGRSMSKPDFFRHSLTAERMEKGIENLSHEERREERTFLERFRHAARMILLMIRAVGLKSERPEGAHYNFLSWTVMYDEVLGISRLNYDSGALTFDPLLFKANKESPISQEAKDILRLPSEQRTDSQIHSVLLCFQQIVPSFAEFPIRIQQSMIKVSTYEKFEAGRVIIRQGHRAENFYFILSGCAVVTEMVSGGHHVHTTNVLGKGNSFGELAFLNMSKRSATVTCREDVELICIEREDFIHIFMRKVKGKEPDHIVFLKTVDLLKGWPVKLLPHDNPKICAFTFVRRGVILCHDSSNSDWIIVVVSGTCRVLKALDDGPIRTHRDLGRSVQIQKMNLASSASCFNVYAPERNMNNKHHLLQGRQQNSRNPEQGKRVRRQGRVENATARNELAKSLLGADLHLSQVQHAAEINAIYNTKHNLPTESNDLPKLPSYGQRPEHVPLFRPKRQSYGLQPPTIPQTVALTPEMDASPDIRQLCREKVFIEVTRLEPGDVFGLDQLVLLGIRDVTSCSLVSDGAEVVLISKKFFKRHLTEETTKRIRQIIRPLPSEKSLHKGLRTKQTWEAYKAHTLAKHTQGKQKINTFLKT